MNDEGLEMNYELIDLLKCPSCLLQLNDDWCCHKCTTNWESDIVDK